MSICRTIEGVEFVVDIAFHQPEEPETREHPFVPESYEINDLYHGGQPFLSFIDKMVTLGRLHPTKSAAEILAEKL